MVASVCLALLAAVTPPPVPPDLGPEGLLRLRAITQALDAGERDAQTWWTSWLFGLSAVAALQGAAVLGLEDHNRSVPVLQAGAVKAAIGAASVVLVPLPSAFAPAALRKLPESTGPDRIAKLKAAEEWLHRAARIERLGKGWLPRAGGLVINGSGALWLWLHHDRPGAAVLSLVGGFAAGELKIWTQPTAAVEAEERLLGAGAPAAWMQAEPPVRWSVSPAPGGLVLAGSF